jgi:predicted Zn-dependent peptidase
VAIAATRLPSGLHVVTERMPDVRSVAAGCWVGTGSRDERPATAGASHFLEHLLFKGTERRTATDIAESVDAVGGDINAFTTKEYTAFYVRLLDEDLDMGLEILGDIMSDSAFRPDEVECERQVILEEILMHADEPGDLVHDVFYDAMYPAHALGWPVLGDDQTISAMTCDDIRAFFQEHYRPVNMVVALAGALDHDAAVEAVERWFRPESGGESPDRRPPEGSPRSLTVVTRPSEQAHIVIGVPALDRDDDDRYALAILDHVLGGGMSSRLFQEVREKRGLAYSVYSFRAGFEGTGALGVYAGTAPTRAHEVIDLIDGELADVAAQGIAPSELARAQGHLRGTIALGLEDSGARMSRIGRSQLVHGEVLTVDEVVGRVEAVTLDDVRRVAERVLGGPRVMAVVGPFQEDDFDAVAVAS